MHCGCVCAGAKRLRGYGGNIKNLRVAEEQHLRLAFLDSYSAEEATLHEQQLPLKGLMITKHTDLAENVVGLAFVRLSNVYSSRLDNLTPEQRVVPLVLELLS